MRLQFATEEHIKLMNAMHEGIIILSNPDREDMQRQFIFANKSARKVFIQNVDLQMISEEHLQVFKDRVHKERLFTPIDQGRTTTSFMNNREMSIDEIITMQ